MSCADDRPYGQWNNTHKCWELAAEQRKAIEADTNRRRGYGALEVCPFCGTLVEADWCDVGVGFIQSGPYNCLRCRASQAGPHDDREGRETHAGWYLPASPPGDTVNTVGGVIVGHKAAERAYRAGLLDDKPRKKNNDDQHS